MDTIFVLRYERDGKRVWETIDAKSYQEAKLAAMRKEIDLFTGSRLLWRRGLQLTKLFLLILPLNST